MSILKVAHEEQRDPGDAFKRAAIGFYLAHHLRLAGFFPAEYNMTGLSLWHIQNPDFFLGSFLTKFLDNLFT